VTVPLIGPDGRRYSLDESELQEALRQGYRIETEETPQTLGESASEVAHEAVQTVGAAAEGAVEGLAPGVLGYAVGAPKGERESDTSYARRRAEAKEMLQRREESPIARGLGELAGMVASPLNKLTAPLEGPRAATVLGRVTQKAVAGAPVGALYGAGSTVSDAMLGDVELTADKLIAGAGLGALLGFAGAGVGAAVEEGARAVMPKLGRSMGDAQKTLDELANDATVKATRAQQVVVNRIGEAKVAEAGRVIRERGHLNVLSNPDDIAKSIEADLAKVGSTKGGFLDAADAAATKPNFGEALKAVDDFAAKLSPLERETVAGNLSKARTALEDIATDPKAGTWRAFDKWKQDLQAMAKFSRGAAEDDLALGLRRQLASVAREELDRQLVPALAKDGAAFLESKATYAALKDAQKLAQSGASRAGGLGLKDLLVGTLGGSLHPAGIATAIGSKFMREHGPALVAKTADAISKSPALAAVAKSMSTQVAGIAPKLGPYGIALAEAFQQSPAMGLATHMTMAQVDPNYEATTTAVGLGKEGPEEHKAALGRAHNLAALAVTAKSTDEEIHSYVERIVKGSGTPSRGSVLAKQDFGNKRMRRSAEASHDKRVEEIRQLATDPNALLERMSKNLEAVGPVAPAVSAALTARAAAAVKYLAQAAEVPPRAGPLAREWTPTQAERFTFAQKLEVVEDPMSVMRHAAAGTLTDTQLEALKTVYPSLYRSMSDAALEKVASDPKNVPYPARMMLSRLTGIDVDGTLSAASIMANQTAIQKSRHNDEAQKQQAAASAGSSPMTLAQRMALPSQRGQLEEGD